MISWDNYVKRYDAIIIDTCSWIVAFKNRKNVFAGLKESLQQNRKELILVDRVRKELEKHRDDRNDPSRSASAQAALDYIEEMRTCKLIYTETLGVDRSGTFANADIQALVDRDRILKNILVITQDNNLFEDLLLKLKQKSVRTSKKLFVMRLNVETGQLEKARRKKPSSQANSTNGASYNGVQGSASGATYGTVGSSGTSSGFSYSAHTSSGTIGIISLLASLILTTVFFLVGNRLEVMHFSYPAWYVIVAYALIAALEIIVIFWKFFDDDEFCVPLFVGLYLICVFGIFFGGMLGNQWVHWILLGVALGIVLLSLGCDVREGTYAVLAPLFVLVPFVLGWVFDLYDVVDLHWGWMVLYFACCALGIALACISFGAGLFSSFCVTVACAGILFGGAFASAWWHMVLVAVSVIFAILTYVANENALK